MNYEMEISQHRPASFLTLNGGVPPLVAGSGTATRLTSNVDFVTTIFNVGTESIPFSLEVWFLPLTNTGELVVIGHTTEGVLWDGTKFILRVKQGDGTAIIESNWTPLQVKAFHVVMVYTPGRASLYIDGEMVTSIELPTANFFATNQPARIHGGTGTGIYDSFAVYYRALTTFEIQQHYLWGNVVPDARSIATAKGASTWSLSYEDVDIFKKFEFTSNDFSQGYIDNVGVENDLLVTGSDAVGVWRQSISLSALDSATTPGIHVTYEGQGVTFAYSLDGITWVNTPNKTTILEDATLNDAMLYFQITLANASSWLKILRLDALASRKMNPLNGNRTLSFKSTAMDQTPGNQLDYQADWGADLGTNGFLTYNIDGNDNPVLVGSTEIWVKINTIPSNFTLLDGQLANGTGTAWLDVSTTGAISPGQGQVYVNGVVRTSGYVLTLNTWHHIVLVENTANNFAGFVGRSRSGGQSGDVTIGHLAAHPQRLSASQITQLYNLNVGAPALRVDDTSSVTMTESSPAASIYAYSWSYVSGGS